MKNVPNNVLQLFRHLSRSPSRLGARPGRQRGTTGVPRGEKLVHTVFGNNVGVEDLRHGGDGFAAVSGYVYLYRCGVIVVDSCANSGVVPKVARGKTQRWIAGRLLFS